VLAEDALWMVFPFHLSDVRENNSTKHVSQEMRVYALRLRLECFGDHVRWLAFGLAGVLVVSLVDALRQ